MATWKQKYQELKNSRKKSFLGQITGAINSFGRRAPPMAFNIASGAAALSPLISRTIWLLQNPVERIQYYGENLSADYTGYQSSTGEMNWGKLIGNVIAIGAPQVVKKGGRMVGVW